MEPEKSEILTAWRDFAKADGSERFMESIQILNEMVRGREWRCGGISVLKYVLGGSDDAPSVSRVERTV